MTKLGRLVNDGKITNLEALLLRGLLGLGFRV